MSFWVFDMAFLLRVVLPAGSNMVFRLPSPKPILFDINHRLWRYINARRNDPGPASHFHYCRRAGQLLRRRPQASACAVRGQPNVGEPRGTARRNIVRSAYALSDAYGTGTRVARKRPGRGRPDGRIQSSGENPA